MNVDFLYRFRSIGKLISEFKELENQSIFFTGKNDLNDPTEGLYETVWNGDKIVWQKLFEHFAFSLIDILILLREDPTLDLSEQDIIVDYKIDLPDEYKQIQQKLQSSLKENRFLQKLISRDILSNVNISKDLLHFILMCLYPSILSTIFPIINPNYVDKYKKTEEDENNIINDISRYLKNLNRSETKIVQKLMINSVSSIENNGAMNNNNGLVLNKFPYLYLEKLEALIYPDWGTVCFSKNCNNVAMWGYYAESHKGVALKFKTQKNKNGLAIRLYFSNGGNSNGKIYDWNLIDFKEVHYGYEDNSLYANFFENISALQPISTSQKWWYINGDERSKYSNKLSDSHNYEPYWDKFYKMITTKHDNWRHEEEYRLIRHEMSRNFSDRLSYYKFEDLEGIIFGIKTSVEDKRKIKDIISKKCETLYNQIKLYLSGEHTISIENVKLLFKVIASDSNLMIELAKNKYLLTNENSLYHDKHELNKELLATLISYPKFEELCNKSSYKRTNFKFYQAYYDCKTKQIETLELFL